MLEDVSWRCSHVTELVANIRVYDQKSEMGVSAEGKVWVMLRTSEGQSHIVG